MAAEEVRFHWADYFVLAAFLVISLAIGVYHSLTGGKQKTTNEFIMANRALAVLPTAISMLVSFKSAVTIMGMIAEVFNYGIEFIVWINYVNVVGCTLAGLIVVPWLFPLKLVSVYEYLELRFKSKVVRAIGATLGITSGILYMGSAMYAPSFALESVTGLRLTTTIPLMAVVTVAYTALGGMRAVIWTDVFQFLVMIGGMSAILIKGTMLIGGFSEAISLCNQEGRLHWLNVNPDPRQRNSVWAFVFGITASRIYMYGLTQAAVQRYSATTTMNKARLTILLNIPGRTFFNFIAGMTGVVVTAHYVYVRCDPIASKSIKNANQILPLYVTTLFADSPGFAGLFLATLYGGALSTISSSLSGISANFWEDVLKWKLNHLSENKKALITRMLVIIFGVLATGVAFLAAKVPGPLTQISLSLKSCVDGPLAGLFLLGGLTRMTNWKGALVGGLCGLSVNIWLSAGSILMKHKHPTLHPLSIDGCYLNQTAKSYTNFTVWSDQDFNYSNRSFDNHLLTTLPTSPTRPPLVGLQNFYSISYLYVLLVGLIVTLTTGFITSLIFRNKEEERSVNRLCLIPWRKAFDFSNDDQTLDKSNPECAADNNDIVLNNRGESLLNGTANSEGTEYSQNVGPSKKL